MFDETDHNAFESRAQRIAGVYAKAFLAVAAAAGKTEALVAELDAFVRNVLDRHPDFQRLLASAFVSREQKAAIIDRVLTGRVADELVVFLQVVSRHDRLDHLRPIHRAVGRQYRAARGRVDVVLRVARPMDGPSRQDLMTALQRTLGADPVVTEVTDPALIGGLVVTVGDTVYDGSVRTRLARLRETMVQRCVEAFVANRARFLVENGSR